MRSNRIGWRLALLVLAAARFVTASPGKARDGVYLFDLALKDSRRVEAPYLPERVYVKFEPEWGKWVLVLSDDTGRLPSPTEAILPGTVVNGTRLGGESDRRYKLTAENVWSATSEPESYWLWVNDDPPGLLHVKLGARR